MRVLVVGAGQVGTAVVEALHDEHDITVVDLDTERAGALAYRYDVRSVPGSGTSRRTLIEAGVREAALVVACTSRDEVNIIAAVLARRLAPESRTVVRTGDVEYLEAWRQRELPFDHMVSSEEESAIAVSQIVGVPSARQTDVFADGQVQIAELDVQTERPGVTGVPLRDASLPSESRVVAIIRGDRQILPRGAETIEPGDRIVVMGSPRAVSEWTTLVCRSAGERVKNVVVFGAGRTGTAVARLLLAQGIDVRLVEADGERARIVADELPRARVLNAVGTEPEFLERERIDRADAAVLAERDDAENLYAAVLLKSRGTRLTIAIAREPASLAVFEQAGVDAAVDPRRLTAEEMVRFAHDPRTRQVAMFEGDRYEVLDVVVRPESKLVSKPFRELPMTGVVIGAIVREGKAVFPHGDDELRPGDRVILFTDSRRATEVENML
ncbi:MAG: Trk system potassium transporter TrkA [Gaiellaceae bacterium]